MKSTLKAGMVILIVVFLAGFQPFVGVETCKAQSDEETMLCPRKGEVWDDSLEKCVCEPCWTISDGIPKMCADLDGMECSEQGACVQTTTLVRRSGGTVILDPTIEDQCQAIEDECSVLPTDPGGGINIESFIGPALLVGGGALAIAAVNKALDKTRVRDKKLDKLIDKLDKKKDKTDKEKKLLSKLKELKRKNKELSRKLQNKGQTVKNKHHRLARENIHKQKQAKQEQLRRENLVRQEKLRQERLRQQQVKAEQQKRKTLEQQKLNAQRIQHQKAAQQQRLQQQRAAQQQRLRTHQLQRQRAITDVRRTSPKTSVHRPAKRSSIVNRPAGSSAVSRPVRTTTFNRPIRPTRSSFSRPVRSSTPVGRRKK